MTTAIEGSVYKLSLDSNGEVWVIAGNKMPSCTHMGVEEYTSNLEKSGAYPSSLRILGSSSNAELIVRLYGLKSKGYIKSIELGSPSISSSDDAASSLMRMRMSNLPASLGGWHEMNQNDCISYGVGVLMRSATSGSHLRACELMKQHPVWGYVNFIPHINDMFFTKVMARIADPRWFIDPTHTNRLSRLYAWLGLCNGPQTDEKLVKKFDVYSCWSEGLTGSSEAMARPGWFIIREGNIRWKDHKPWVRTLRMSQLFIKFLNVSWTDCIYPYPNNWMEKILEPGIFFNSSVDSLGFATHKRLLIK